MPDQALDFPLSELPSAAALRDSFAHNSVESELRDLFLEVFAQVAPDTFDASVLGAPHLGTFGLVRRMVNHDGLVLLRGEHDEAATRYLYRAWRSGDVQKRGMHFLRTYLQLLLPNQVQVEQLWHDQRFPYGTAFRRADPRPILFHFLSEPSLRLDGAWGLGRPVVPYGDPPPIYQPDAAELFLTSRLDIALSVEAVAANPYQLPGRERGTLSDMIEVIRAVIPARLVPSFRFWLILVLFIQARLSYRLRMEKHARLRYPWCGRVVTDSDDARWALGRNPWPVRLPQPFGSFRVGELRGDPWTWGLRGCRISAPMLARLQGVASIYRLPTLEPWRRVNGSWSLAAQRSSALTAARLAQRATVQAPASVQTTLRDWIRLDFPRTPAKLGRALAVDGRWRLDARSQIGGSLGPAPSLARGAAPGTLPDVFGSFKIGAMVAPSTPPWRLGRRPAIPASATTLARLAAPVAVRPERLMNSHAPGPLVRRTLNGWPLGRAAAPVTAHTGRFRAAVQVAPAHTGQRTLANRLALTLSGPVRTLGRQRTLSGQWQLRHGERLSLAMHAPRLSGWALNRTTPVTVQHAGQGRIGISLPAAPARLGRHYSTRLRAWPRRLDGLWPLGAAAHLGRFRLDGATALKNRKITQCHRLGTFTLRLDRDADRAWPVYEDLARQRTGPRLDRAWRVGGPATVLEASLRIITREPRYP